MGSAKRGLTKRIDRHRKKEKKLHWHIDYLREQADLLSHFRIDRLQSYLDRTEKE